MSHYFTFKKNIALLCLIGFVYSLSAQSIPDNKKNYALLWEITGNGLTKPSYLFGTMHLRDKRVFEFSDSVLLKLESCEAFASEVRMDSAVYQQWELSMSGDTTNRLSKKLSKKGYERLIQALKSKGINMDSLESKNSNLIEGWLTERAEDKKEEDRDLFLDLYLTRLAYTEGKSIHGLERLEDYEDLNDSFFQQFEDSTFTKKETSILSIFKHFAQMQEMIEVYKNGDLDNILRIIKSQKTYNGDQHSREMLDNRNVRMLQKMENIMREKSVFCAVGAAHLPDSMGLITLLRNKGYAVRKVTPQFTGLVQQYKEKKVEREWYHLKDDFNRFELDFPEQPYLMNKLSSNRKRLGLQYIYYDIITGAIHIAEADFFPYIGKKIAQDKILENTFNDWYSSRTFKNLVKEKITIGESEGYQFSATSKSDGSVLGRFFVANNTIYKTVVFFDKHNKDNTERAEIFLKSLKISPLPLPDWQNYEDEKGAFSMKMPVKPDFQELRAQIPFQTGEELAYYYNIFQSKDIKEGITYLLRYNDMPQGMYIENDSFYLSNLIQESIQNFKKLKAKIEIDSLTKHYGNYPEYNIKVSVDGISLLMRAVLRANRSYLLIAQPPLVKNKDNDKKLEESLNSFRFLPYKEPQLTKKDFPEMGINIGLPTSREEYKYAKNKGNYPSKEEISIQVTDNYSGSVYVISRTEFSKYYGITNPDTFWNTYIRDLKSAGSELLNITTRDTLFKGLKAQLITFDYTKSLNTFKSIIFEKDGYQYEVSLILPYEIATDEYTKKVFETIDFIGKNDKKDIFSSKKQLIINDLASSIDSVREEANQALLATEWVKDDLNLLVQAVQRKYADDTLSEGGTRMNLLNEITKFKDASTLDLLEKLAKNTEKDTFLRNEILYHILNFDSLNSPNRFFEIAQSLNLPDLSEFYFLKNFLIDSIERAQLYYDKMLNLVKNPLQDEMIILTTSTLAENDTLGLMKETFARYTPQYLKAVQTLFEKYEPFLKIAQPKDQKEEVNEGDENSYAINYYIQLFRAIPSTPEIIQFLKKILIVQDDYMLSEAIHSLTKNGETVDGKQWQRLLKDKANWYYLLQALKRDSLLSKVPPQYLIQKDITEGVILSYLNDEDYGESKEFVLLETQKYKGQILYVFKYKMEYGNDETKQCIAICAQPMDKSKYDLDPSLLLISDPLDETSSYKKVVEELLSDFEKRKVNEK